MRVTLLGTGTSTGVPLIGCRCAVCMSADPRNRRLRPGARLELPGASVLVDTPTDLREQCLRFGVDRVDAVVFTHAHADHIFGLDDLRVFNFRQGGVIACYGAAPTLAALRRVFAYAFEQGQEGGGKPRIELLPVDGRFAVAGVDFVPIPVWHGETPVLGYRVGRFAYVTDCSRLPPASEELLGGLDVLVLGALRYRPHPTHMTIAMACELVSRLRPRRAVLTHLAHEVDHGAPRWALPEPVEFGYDGLFFEVSHEP
jgi:phosphoribosyl 1,2-cyclic phosphate phosphodiesterase